jgi:hypothetical protein
MEQLCQSRVTNGEYDQLIRDMFPTSTLKEILDHIMVDCRGQENPKLVKERIKQIIAL